MDRLSTRAATLSSTRVAARVFTSALVLCVLSMALPAQEDLVRVRVRLEPEDPEQPIVASHLEVGVKHHLPPRRGDRGDGFWLFGDGVSLTDGRREVEVLLPTVPTRLRVRSNAGEVLGGMSWQDEEPLGELQLTPEVAGTQTVVIKVRAPTKSGKVK